MRRLTRRRSAGPEGDPVTPAQTTPDHAAEQSADRPSLLSDPAASAHGPMGSGAAPETQDPSQPSYGQGDYATGGYGGWGYGPGGYDPAQPPYGPGAPYGPPAYGNPAPFDPQEQAAAELEQVTDLPAGLDPDELAAVPSSSAHRGRLRKRVAFLRAARELLLRDLGGFVYELHRTAGDVEHDAHRRLRVAKLARLTHVDAELHELEARLDDVRRSVIVREPGVGGECPQCGELYGSDAHYCSHCGMPLTDVARRALERTPGAVDGATGTSPPTEAAAPQPYTRPPDAGAAPQPFTRPPMQAPAAQPYARPSDAGATPQPYTRPPAPPAEEVDEQATEELPREAFAALEHGDFQWPPRTPASPSVSASGEPLDGPHIFHAGGHRTAPQTSPESSGAPAAANVPTGAGAETPRPATADADAKTPSATDAAVTTPQPGKRRAETPSPADAPRERGADAPAADAALSSSDEVPANEEPARPALGSRDPSQPAVDDARDALTESPKPDNGRAADAGDDGRDEGDPGILRRVERGS